MREEPQHPDCTSLFSESNDNQNFKTQLDIIAEAFRLKPSTMWQVSIRTGITRPNVCRHVAELLKRDDIVLLKKGLCPISHYRAGFYTSDKSLFPSTTSTYTLFDECLNISSKTVEG